MKIEENSKSEEDNKSLLIKFDNRIKLISSQSYDELEQGHGLFTDILFPHNEVSLRLDQNEKLTWRRMSSGDICEEFYIIRAMDTEDDFKDDVMSGNLGDLYFLSTLSIMAERPDRMLKLLGSYEPSKGLYEIMAYLNGIPVSIVIDDYFPCREGKKELLPLALSTFNPSSMNIWHMLIEKAWAKANMNYKNIILGNCYQAFEFLCPSPVVKMYHGSDHDNNKEEALYSMLKYGLTQQWIIAAEVNDKPGVPLSHLTEFGLLPNYAYSILSVHELTNGTRLIKLRKPMDDIEWNGDWSENSSKWTGEVKEKLKCNFSDKRIFYIAFSDYYKFFTCSTICKYHDDYHYCYKKNLVNDISKDEIQVMVMSIPQTSAMKPIHGYIIISLKNSKIYRSFTGDKKFTNPYTSMLVFKQDDHGKIRYISSVSGRQDRIFVEGNFDPGEYLIFVNFKLDVSTPQTYQTIHSFANFQNIQQHPYVIGFYSQYKPGEVTFQSQELSKELFQNLFFKSILSKAEDSQEKEYLDQEKLIWRTMEFLDNDTPYGCLVYHNQSPSVVKEELLITSLSNVRIFFLGFWEDETASVISESTSYGNEFENQLVEKIKIIEKVNSELNYSFPKKKDSDANANLDISQDNPLKLSLEIAPFSTYAIMLEKCDEAAKLCCENIIYIEYPLNFILQEKMFKGKSRTLKYQDCETNIIENIIKSPSGVVFKYTNSSDNFRFENVIVFDKLVNLQFSTKFEKLFEELNSQCAKEKRKLIDFDYVGNSVKICLEPMEGIFVELVPINQFEKFSYSSKMQYKVSLSDRSKAK